MMRFVIGTLALALTVGFVSRSVTDRAGSPSATTATQVETISSAPPISTPKMGNGLAANELNRSPDGHFYADLMVNGAPVHFLVDTGASTVALTRQDAQKVGLQFSDGEFTSKAKTANGEVALKPVTLDRVTLGPLEATQVDAAIIDQGLDISLLGQSWLRRVGTVTIEGDRMVLR